MRDDQNESGIQLQGVPFVHALSAERSSPKLKVWSFIKQFAMLVFIYLFFLQFKSNVIFFGVLST